MKAKDNDRIRSVDLRMDDPEFVWKQETTARWSNNYYDRQISAFISKMVVCIVLFIIVWIISWSEHPFAQKGFVWLEKMMLEDINFSAAAHIYSSYFGDVPSFLPALRSNDSKSVASVSSRTMKNLFQPVHGTIIIPYHPLTKGITVRVRAGESIFAMDSGLVIEKENHVVHGHTIILQHANGLKSIYGGVLNSTRNKNEWVKGGEKLGIVHEGSEEGFGTLFIAMIVDNESIDPTEVISID